MEATDENKTGTPGVPDEGRSACPACGAPHGPGARFCRACGRRLPVTCGVPGDEGALGPVRTCPACGAEASPTALFCRVCGTALGSAAQGPVPPAPVAVPACPACGAEVNPAAKFCRACGASLAPAPAPVAAQPRGTAKQSHRRTGRARTAVLAVAAVILVGGAALLALRFRGDGDGEPTAIPRESRIERLGPAPGPGPNGLERHAPVRLVHPGGAELTVPPGDILYSEYLDLRRLEAPPESPAWRFAGPAYTFVSVTGVVHEDPIEIRLPAAGAGADAVIVALAPSGAWQPLPTERVGDRLVAALAGVPAPWTVAVASPKPFTRPADLEPTGLADAERLAFADRAAWREEARAWLEAHPVPPDEELEQAASPSASLLASRSAAAAPVAIEFSKWEKEYAETLLRLAGAGAVLEAGRAGVVPALGAGGPVAFEHYRAGVLTLLKLRDRWFQNRDAWSEMFGERGNYQAVLLDSGVALQDSLETAFARYAPWGIELTAALVRSRAIADIDLAVVYGEALFADVILPPGMLPDLERQLTGQGGWAGTPEMTLRLRLFSRAAIENWSLLDYLKDWRTEAFLRYLPVALWVLGISSGGPSLLAATVADQVLNWWQAQYETASSPAIYGTIQWATTALAGGQLLFDATDDTLVTSFGLRIVDLSEQTRQTVGTALGWAQFLYSAAVSWAVTGSDWYLLKDIRAITEGTRGYCPGGRCNWLYAQNIPPVQVIGVARGAAARPADYYPATRVRMAAWNLQYNPAAIAAGRLDLHEIFRSGSREASLQVGSREALTGPAFLRNLGWEPYVKESWPDATIDITPDLQAIRIAVPRADLAKYRSWSRAKLGDPIADYNLLLRLETADGDHQVLRITGVDTERSTADRENVYLIAALATRKDAGRDDLEPGFRGSDDNPTTVERSSVTPLRQRYTAYLYASGQQEEDWVPVEVVFPPNPGPRTDADVVAAPRVHETDAAASAKPPTEWTLVDVRLEVNGTFKDPYALYLLSFVERIAPSACRLERKFWDDGEEFGLHCVFEPGCPRDESCFSLNLASVPKPDYPLGSKLTITKDRIQGYLCTGATDENACSHRSFIDAALAPGGQLSGQFGWTWDEMAFGEPYAQGTWTVQFTASPKR
ncbi:zinc ribbon domain-containing protein [Tepidiforma thermophila]|uniref:Double zinc ribbon protein n=1 Tax=Tepidiforma thermophila (strain KCTC 52669 / CGMCC 1.13589 / G233) TaxID=2761530 RepID=A0A2A9HEJ3_TEPT2|nr:zinc ribbon domain-containing protein [Tepidiforma thermophila]PFG73219.1 double zinc ribbon protein [Tepidiforma thermophila]